MDLPQQQNYVASARHICKAILAEMGVPARMTETLEVIIGELCANVVLHVPDPSVGIDLEFHPKRTVVSVRDNGPGFDPEAIPEVGAPRRTVDGRERIGGFGLLIVQSLADMVHFERLHPVGMKVSAVVSTPQLTEELSLHHAGLQG